MNGENCSLYVATDRNFEKIEKGKCDTNLIVYGVTYVLMLFLRIMLFINRLCAVKVAREPTKYYRFLWHMIITAFKIFAYFLYFLLSILDIINVDNGGTFAVFTFAFICVAITQSLDLYFVVRLGLKIGSVPDDLGNTEQLTTFDAVGMRLVFGAISMLVLMSLLLIVVGPSHPEDYIIFGILGFISKGVFEVFMSSGMIWQLHRCIQLISTKMPESSRREDIIKKFRLIQTIHFCFGLGTSIIFFLLASRIFLWHWWIVLSTGYAENLFAILVGLKKMTHGHQQQHRDRYISKREEIVRNHNQEIPRVKDNINISQIASNNIDHPEAKIESAPPFSIGANIKKYRKKRKHNVKMSRITEMSEKESSLMPTTDDI